MYLLVTQYLLYINLHCLQYMLQHHYTIQIELQLIYFFMCFYCFLQIKKQIFLKENSTNSRIVRMLIPRNRPKFPPKFAESSYKRKKKTQVNNAFVIFGSSISQFPIMIVKMNFHSVTPLFSQSASLSFIRSVSVSVSQSVSQSVSKSVTQSVGQAAS